MKKQEKNLDPAFLIVENLGIIHLVSKQNFSKTIIFLPLIRIRASAYQEVKNVGFSENFVYALNERSHYTSFWGRADKGTNTLTDLFLYERNIPS